MYFSASSNRAPVGNNSRGWMLHFNAGLTQTKIPGAFGWDNTPSIVPAAAVPQYTGPSTYLLATKYNNYAGAGTGNGQNRMAVLDPSTAAVDPVSGIPTMREVLTILGPDGGRQQSRRRARVVREHRRLRPGHARHADQQ